MIKPAQKTIKSGVSFSSAGSAPRRIGFVANSGLGMYQFRRDVALQLQSAGYEVHCIVPEDAYTGQLIAAGLSVHLIKMQLYGRNPFQELALYRSLKDLYASLDLDLIFHYTLKPNIYGTFAASALQIPSVMIVPGLGNFPDLGNPLLRGLIMQALGKAVRLADEVWFLNEHDHGYYEGKDWLNETKSRILPSEGVNTEHYEYVELNSSDENKPLQVLFAGRILASKGVRDYVEAARICKQRGLNVVFTIAGFLGGGNPDAIDASEVEQWHQSGLINFVGDTDDIRPLLEMAHLVVLPTKYREGISRILLEAMAIGRPILTTPGPGTSPLVTHMKNGYLVPTDDPRAIAEAIDHFASLPHSSQVRMGSAGRRVVEANYSVAQVMRVYAAYIQERLRA